MATVGFKGLNMTATTKTYCCPTGAFCRLYVVDISIKSIQTKTQILTKLTSDHVVGGAS